MGNYMPYGSFEMHRRVPTVSLVGCLRCKEGIVLVSDTRVTKGVNGDYIENVEKIIQISRNVGMMFVGSHNFFKTFEILEMEFLEKYKDEFLDFTQIREFMMQLSHKLYSLYEQWMIKCEDEIKHTIEYIVAYHTIGDNSKCSYARLFSSKFYQDIFDETEQYWFIGCKEREAMERMKILHPNYSSNTSLNDAIAIAEQILKAYMYPENIYIGGEVIIATLTPEFNWVRRLDDGM